ncbi:hypothetical protein [Roseibium suaedae]|nr:hypothetical protein [Roseibium suaedae]
MDQWWTFRRHLIRLLERLGAFLAVLLIIALSLALSGFLAAEALILAERALKLLMVCFALVLASHLLLQGAGFLREVWSLFALAVLALSFMLEWPGLLALLLLRLFPALGLWPELAALLWAGKYLVRMIRQLLRGLLALLILFACAVLLLTAAFADLYPDHFGTLSRSFFTLVHVLDLLGSEANGLGSLAIWLVMTVWALAALLCLAHCLRLLMPDFWQTLELEEELELVQEATSEMKLMQLETRLLSEEFAVEAEAERLLIRAETDRILREVEGLRRQMQRFTRPRG